MISRWVVITDLDGTFLNPDDYDHRPLLPAVRNLKESGIPIVFCSSKTRAEIQSLRSELGIRDPFIVENGGAIYVEENYFQFSLDRADRRDGLLVIVLGTPYPELIQALDTAEGQTGCLIQRFGRADEEELCRMTGLSKRQAALARQREFDEPFWFVASQPAARKFFLRILRRMPGLRVTRGNRFYHLKGVADKGSAVDILKGYYRRLWPKVRFIGLGDSVNDIPLLRVVDVPILLRDKQGHLNRDVLAAVPHVLQSPVAGTLSWAALVLPLVGQSRLRGNRRSHKVSSTAQTS